MPAASVFPPAVCLHWHLLSQPFATDSRACPLLSVHQRTTARPPATSEALGTAGRGEGELWRAAAAEGFRRGSGEALGDNLALPD